MVALLRIAFALAVAVVAVSAIHDAFAALTRGLSL